MKAGSFACAQAPCVNIVARKTITARIQAPTHFERPFFAAAEVRRAVFLSPFFVLTFRTARGLDCPRFFDSLAIADPISVPIRTNEIFQKMKPNFVTRPFPSDLTFALRFALKRQDDLSNASFRLPAFEISGIVPPRFVLECRSSAACNQSNDDASRVDFIPSVRRLRGRARAGMMIIVQPSAERQ